MAKAEQRNITGMSIQTEYIKLEQLLKFAGAVPSGGEAKEHILDGEVTVNGEVCLQRGKKLRIGDEIGFDGEIYRINPPND